MKKTSAVLVSVLALLSALLVSGTAASAQDRTLELIPQSERYIEPSPTGSYIVVLNEEPVVAEVGRENLGTAEAKRLSDELTDSHDEVLDEAGAETGDKIQDYTIALNGFAAKLSHDEALALAANPKVRAIVHDELRQPTTDSSGDFLRLTVKNGAYDTGVTGKGVVVGVIDTGIWPEHPSFADTGLPAPPVTLEDTPENPACEFGNVAHHPDDAPFTCNNKLIGARQVLPTYRALIGANPGEFDSARDDNGHGTHTAATAAGNSGVEASILGRHIGTVGGIAPDAHVIAYKGLGALGGFGSDLAGAIDQAVADGVDVINYSVGGGAGLGGPDDIAYLFAADAGVFVATSAGNSGPGPYTVGSPADAPWVFSVGASTQSRSFEAKVRLGNGKKLTGVSVTSPSPKAPLVDAEDVGGELCLAGTLDPDQVSGKIVLCRRGLTARVSKSAEVARAGGVGMIMWAASETEDLLSDTHSVPSLHINVADGLKVKAYIDKASSPTAEIRSFDAKRTNAPVMADFSSRGPNISAPDLIKPDITAPGVQILAGTTPVPESGVAGELFMAIAGTSMSSPHVAGALALMKEAHPDWTPAMAKSALMTSAYQQGVKDSDGTKADPFDFGAGHLSPGKLGRKGSSFNPGLVYDAGFFDYVAFLCEGVPGLVGPGTCAALEGAGYSLDASDLNLPSIGVAELAGSQTVTRTVTSVADRKETFRARVDAPDGYVVDVSPDKITLDPGESATFEVTITNDGSAPVGEWRFGALQWKNSKGYDVRSPIAVRGAAINAPELVEGTGTDGSASFTVAFGYDGDYGALAYGLVAESTVSGIVDQDPDQGFDPNDGFSQAHTFDLTGVDLFRLSMNQAQTQPDVDIDIFVADPSGNIVANSTSGGTAEFIEITEPEAGTWTVYIHGWQTVTPSVDYELSTWVVPTFASSLSVDAAPAAAVTAGSGVVDISWAGLTAGGNYLGVVAHSDGESVISRTIVEVHG